MKIIKVTWHDATSCDAWEDLGAVMNHGLHEVTTCGFFIHENDERLIVALNLDEVGNSASQYIAIPKAWITERKDVEV